MAKATTNAKQWQAAMKTWLRAKRLATHDDCINHFAKQSCIKAMVKTPKARKGSWPLGATANPEKGGRTKKQKIFYALAAKGGATRGKGIKAAAMKIYTARRRGIGAIKAGFIKPAKELGAKLGARTFGRGSASRSRGYLSRRLKMKATAVNNVPGAGTVAYRPMEAAKAEVVRKEHQWAIRRLQKANNLFSAKKY